VPEVMNADRRRRTVAQGLGAPGKGGLECAAEPLGMQVAAFKIAECQRVIAGQRQGQRSALPLPGAQQRRGCGSMSITRGLPVLVGPSTGPPPLPLLRTTPADRRIDDARYAACTDQLGRIVHPASPASAHDGDASRAALRGSPKRDRLRRPLQSVALRGDRGGSMSRLQEGQQVGVDGLGLRSGHAVREAVVGLQRPVLEKLGRQWC
jgi:hypothetical protein